MGKCSWINDDGDSRWDGDSKIASKSGGGQRMAAQLATALRRDSSKIAATAASAQMQMTATANTAAAARAARMTMGNGCQTDVGDEG